MHRFAAGRRHDRQRSRDWFAVVPDHIQVNHAKVGRRNLDEDFHSPPVVEIEQLAGNRVGDGSQIDGGVPRQGAVLDAVAVALEQLQQAVELCHLDAGARAVAVGHGCDQPADPWPGRRIHPGTRHELHRYKDRLTRRETPGFDPI